MCTTIHTGRNTCLQYIHREECACRQALTNVCYEMGASIFVGIFVEIIHSSASYTNLHWKSKLKPLIWHFPDVPSFPLNLNSELKVLSLLSSMTVKVGLSSCVFVAYLNVFYIWYVVAPLPKLRSVSLNLLVCLLNICWWFMRAHKNDSSLHFPKCFL